MKKPFLLFLLLVFVSRAADAQVSAGPVFNLCFANVKGGLNDQANKFKIGMRAGFFLKLDVSESVSIQPEILYSTRGYVQKSLSSTSVSVKDTSIKHNFSYIDFPFLANIRAADNIYMLIGPQLGYLSNARSKGTISIGPKTSAVDTNDVYGFNTTEYSLVMGGGYKFKFPLDASLRFTYGLTKLYQGEGKTSHNFYFQIGVSYSFGSGSGVGSSGGSTIYKTF